MPLESKIIASVPTAIDLDQAWLTDYWAADLGVSKARLHQAVLRVGRDAAKIRRFVSDSVTLAIRDSVGTLRRAAKFVVRRMSRRSFGDPSDVA